MEADGVLRKRALERRRIAAKQTGAGIQNAGPGLLVRQLVDDGSRRSNACRSTMPQSKAGSSGACASNMSSQTCQIWSSVRLAAVCGSSMAAW